ncbi:tyrosine-type recombinase/integrase [Olsenella uli]|uniref:tyrosine-type recombinase/integrase n=1 Tax=Olsenella uli TaxID=133926 RepID=UPI00325F9E71
MARKKQRETYGNGSIVPVVDEAGNQKHDKKGDPIWRVCVSFGYKETIDENGRKHRRQDKTQRNFHGTLKDARKFSQRIIKEHEEAEEQKKAGIDAELTFTGLCKAWEDDMRFGKVCNAYKLKSYVTHLGYMGEYFGDKPVTQVTEDDVRMALRGTVRKRKLSDTTASSIFAVTKRVFTYARKKGKISINPCEDMKAPRPSEAVDRNSLQADECALIRATLDRDEKAAYAEFQAKEERQRDYDPFKGSEDDRGSLRGMVEISNVIAIRLMLATGMRRGEVLGLTWSAVNFATKQIKVVQALAIQKLSDDKDEFDDEVERIEVKRSQSGKSSLVIKRPKTKKGIRTLFVDDETLAHLREWKKFQAKAFKLIRVDEDGEPIMMKQTQATPVFCNSCGSWYDPSHLNRWWAGTTTKEGYRDKIGFPDLKMHEFCHTQATMLLGNGVDVKTVQSRLGHAKSSHTLDLYAHAIPANDQAAANLMASICAAPAVPKGTILEIPRSA